MAKRPRDEKISYEDSMEERARQTIHFLSSLRFSKPLADIAKISHKDTCPKCQKRHLFYCYNCLAVCTPKVHPPPLKLPVAVHVVFHPGEHRAKSTSLPAAIVSPDVHIHTFPDIPNLNPDKTLLLYPSNEATSIHEIADIATIENVLFIDSTWQKSKVVANDPRLKAFRPVRIQQQTSLFWRFQNNDPSHLATVEAIYFCVKEILSQLKKKNGEKYDGEVDDLLYYYVNQYIMIQKSYVQGGRGEFTDRHFENYILKGIDWNVVIDVVSQNVKLSSKK